MQSNTIGFIGVGNMGQSMIASLLQSGDIKPQQICAFNRSPGKLKKVEELFGVSVCTSSDQLIDRSTVIVLAVKPQDIRDLLETVGNQISANQFVISLAAGVSLTEIQKYLPQKPFLARVMPNTPISIQKGVVGYVLADNSRGRERELCQLLKPLGFLAPVIEGEHLDAFTVSTSSGVGFVFELMMYWQEWLEEHGYDEVTAKQMTAHTFLGAAMLAEGSPQVSFQELENRVASKKGVTEAGLQSMRELEIERALRYSFEKAVLRIHQLENGR